MTGKERLIRLLTLLESQTDEAHPISTPEIVEHFTQMGVLTDRKTVREDIKTLVDCGIDIVSVRSSVTKYFYDGRPFELPELKLLIDAVESSKFITAKKSEVLASKLASLAGKFSGEELKRHLYVSGRIKPENESVYYVIDAVHRAINQKRKISFQYFEYTPQGKRVPRHNGEPFIYSPYAVLYIDDRYYMLGYRDAIDRIAPLRIDRMGVPTILAEKIHPKPAGFNPADYTVENFGMYNGETVSVRLVCKNSLMDQIVDRFGTKVKTAKVGDEHFAVVVPVAVSPTFFAWVFQFCGAIQITEPGSVCRQYREMLEGAKI